jgi:hypothetical protein
MAKTDSTTQIVGEAGALLLKYFPVITSIQSERIGTKGTAVNYQECHFTQES